MKPEHDDFQQGISNSRGSFSGSMFIFGFLQNNFQDFAAILAHPIPSAWNFPALVPAWKTPNIPFAARYLATPNPSFA